MITIWRLGFCKYTHFDTEVRYWGIVNVKHNKTVSLDFYPFSVCLFYGKNQYGN